MDKTLAKDAAERAIEDALTPEGFVAWLREHLDDEVGVASRAMECPVARYVDARTGLAVCAFDTVEAWPGGTDLYHQDAGEPMVVIHTPRWAYRFIGFLDGGRRLDATVTGRDALAVLEEVATSGGAVQYPRLAAALEAQ